jgi:hypothetical protein
VGAADLEKILFEILEIAEGELRGASLDDLRRAICAGIACRAAIKINTRLDAAKMEWLLRALAATDCPMSCPHGRPIAMHYSTREILKAFQQNGQHGPRNVTSGPVPYNITCGGTAQAAPAPAGGRAAQPAGFRRDVGGSRICRRDADPLQSAGASRLPVRAQHQVDGERPVHAAPTEAVLAGRTGARDTKQGLGGPSGLKRNPARETDYSYQVTFFGQPYQTAARYQVEAIPRRPGLGGFLFVSDRRGFSDFYYNADN